MEANAEWRTPVSVGMWKREVDVPRRDVRKRVELECAFVGTTARSEPVHPGGRDVFEW